MSAVPGLGENFQRFAKITCVDSSSLFAGIGPINLSGIEVEGLRITFDIKKGPKLKTNKAKIKVYNMSPDSRGFVQIPVDDLKLPVLQIQLDVGYGGDEKILFLGRATAVSTWEPPNWVTTFEATDGDVQFDLFQYEKKFPTKTPIFVIVNDILAQSGLDLGSTLPISGHLKKSRTFSGPPLHILQDLASTHGFAFDVQDEKIRLVPGGFSIVTSSIIKLDASSGMIGTPRVKDNLVIVDMLINPDVKPGTFITLISVTDKLLSGVYLVKKMSFKGDNWGGSWIANVEMQSIFEDEILSLHSSPLSVGGIA